jgi:hypothetical protein
MQVPLLAKNYNRRTQEKGQEHRYINQSSSYITIIILLSDNVPNTCCTISVTSEYKAYSTPKPLTNSAALAFVVRTPYQT